ncbi:uncharacterized protein PHACADRAFT_248866 [Phanerochaete carnosa HHB-10118-sp]|uniref:Uncharacterized protein n=1 Tax=Phanerochaete carnosa (strain HHB-10118-sp) TaxID=650164 RepID=K5V7M9_PHACS|nr:uncharacterized protein PHACADRAFT_248866 [Phanerochaete carnosa HHB-10118-sp]EKM58776.1 hypothetical protein PHACADRAFT_248866 [Phanerochaete carnosa HHB-10118-sp]
MEDVICHERECDFARRRITASDLAKSPNASLDGAGRLVDWRAFVGPEEADARPLKSKQLVFTDPQHPDAECICYAVSTHGNLLAASFNSTDIFVWRLPDGLLVQRLHDQGHSENVRSLSFSSNGHTLVSGSDDKTAIVWDVQSGRVLRRLEEHRSGVDNTAYSPANTLIATSDLDKFVKIWDASTGACLHSFALSGYASRLIFSPDSSRLCIKVPDSCVIYDMQTYRRIAVLRHDNTDSISFSMTRRGDRIVTGASHRNGVMKWDATTGRDLMTIDDERRPTAPVAFSPDGTEILAGRYTDQMALAYDSRTAQLRHIFWLSHTPSHVAYSPNGDYVVFAGMRGSLEVYGAKSRTFIGRVEGVRNAEIRGAEFLSDSQTVLLIFTRTSYEPLCLCNIHDLVRMR